MTVAHWNPIISRIYLTHSEILPSATLHTTTPWLPHRFPRSWTLLAVQQIPAGLSWFPGAERSPSGPSIAPVSVWAKCISKINEPVQSFSVSVRFSLSLCGLLLFCVCAARVSHVVDYLRGAKCVTTVNVCSSPLRDATETQHTQHVTKNTQCATAFCPNGQ